MKIQLLYFAYLARFMRKESEAVDTPPSPPSQPKPARDDW